MYFLFVGFYMKNIDITRRVGVNIKLLRLREGLTTRTLAKYVKVSQQQLSRYERGVNKIDVSFIYRLCVFFNVGPEYFFENIFLEAGCAVGDDYCLTDIGALCDRL